MGEALTASLTGPEMAMSPPGASWEKGKTFRLSRSRQRARLSLKVKKSDDGEGKERGKFVKLHARWDMPEVFLVY